VDHSLPGHAPALAPAPLPAWDDHPLALVERERLRAISGPAARAQIRIGMMVAEARARSAALELLDWDDTAIARGITEVTAQLLAASPQVTPVAGEPGLWWVGAGSIRDLDEERALALALAALARSWHPRAAVAIADSCVTARAATWERARRKGVEAPGSSDVVMRIVPPGSDAAYLAPAPLALIPMEDELRQTLAALGIGTAGAFAALEAGDVEQRWGDAGLASWRLARGEDARRPVLAIPPTVPTVDTELAAPTETTEPLLFLVRAALERLATGLARDARAAAAIAITLTLDGPRSALPSGAIPHTVTREVRFPRPTARAVHLFEHCRALLDSWTLTAPVCGVAVSVAATAPTAAEQGDLLALGWRDPAAADAALTRLRTELGPRSVVRPVAGDDHRPERSGEWMEEESAILGGGKAERASPSRTKRRLESDDEPPLLLLAPPYPDAGARTPAIRLLESPEAVEIEQADRQPCALWWRGRRLTIARASGPDRLAGDWWRDPYHREYWWWECELGELLVFTDAGRWYVHGWGD